MRINGEIFRELRGAQFRNFEGRFPIEFSGFNIDTRKLLPGEIFVALRTASRDGHDFLEIARERGASAALVSRFCPESKLPQIIVSNTLEALQRLARLWRAHNRACVLGITGSVGKTSTKDLLTQIFSKRQKTHATFANLNNTIGVPLTLLSGDSEEDWIVEAGMSIPGELERSAWVIAPDIALITNVKAAHLEGLGSLENIAREKSALARQIAPNGIAVFPAELLAYSAFSQLHCSCIPVAFSGTEYEDLKIRAAALDSKIASLIYAKISEHEDAFCIELSGTKTPFKLKTASIGLAQNAALSIVAAQFAGIADEAIQDALDAWKPSAKRGEIIRLSNGNLCVVDCYNASPASMLDSARAFVKSQFEGSPEKSFQRLFVLGGMGELGKDSLMLHRDVGEKLPLDSTRDFLALFGGNAFQIGEGAITQGFPRERIYNFCEIEKLREFVAKFHGNIMIKGSRAFALERVIPQ